VRRSSIIESQKNYACDAYRWKNTILDVLQKKLFLVLPLWRQLYGQGETAVGSLQIMTVILSKNDMYYTNGLRYFIDFE
jgi:hypothetical protein